MVKTQTKSTLPVESDSSYFLKLVLYVILGATWIKFGRPFTVGPLQLSSAPIGMVFGIILASKDQFAIDRKVEYAILLIMMIITFFLPAGIVL